MNEEIFDKCIKVLQTSKADNEILAALLMVTKVVKDDQCNLEMVLKIFNACGVEFLRRLLRTGGTAEDCSSLSFKSVAVSILSCFCAVQGFVAECHVQLHHLLPHVAQVTNIKQESVDDADTAQQLLTDAYDCLTCVVSDRLGQEAFIKAACVPTICHAVLGKCLYHEKGLELLLYLCESNNGDVWRTSVDQFIALVDSFISDMELEKNDNVFDVCRNLSVLLGSAGKPELAALTPTPLPARLHARLFHLLQNKLGGDQRCLVLRLCAAATGLLGVSWVLGHQGGTGHKFLLLMVHLACIEIRMNLDNEAMDKILANSGHLGYCYSLLENVIEHLTAGPSLQLDDKQVVQLHAAMVGAFNGVIQFLDLVSNQTVTEDMRPLVIASVRVLGSWIAEETSALREEVLALLPFLIETSRDSFQQCVDQKNTTATSSNNNVEDSQDGSQKKRPNVAMDTEQSNTEEVTSDIINTEDLSTHDSKPISVPPKTTATENLQREFQTVDLLQFLMPGLCHLSAEDSAREVLLTSDLTQLLQDYMVYQWRRMQSSHSDQSGVDKEPVVVMTTTCGVIMNIVVLEAHLVGTSPLFEEMFNFVAMCLGKLAGSGDEFVTFQYNLMLIGLMIIRRRVDSNVLPQSVSDEFMSDAIKLLKQVHTSTSTKKSGSAVLSCHDSWGDISELWGLGIQVLCECIALLPWLPKSILASKWLPRSCKMLLDVKVGSVPEDVIVGYQNLFCSLASNSNSSVIQVLKDSGVVQVARKFKTELSPKLEELVR